MAINFLSNDESIQGKWGPPPKLDAPAIGSTLAAILENKYRQQVLAQKSIADAVKNIQERRQADAYAQALQNTGLSEGQDLSGLSPEAQTRMVQALAARTPDDQRNAVLEAQAREANAKAGMYENYGSGDGGDGSSQFYIDPDTGLRMQRTPRGPKLAPLYAQPNVAPQKTADVNVARPLYDDKQAAVEEAARRKKIIEDRFNVQGGAFPDLEGGRKARVQAKYTKRLLEEQNAAKVRDTMLKKYPGLAAPEPAPAETGDALPTTQAQPKAGGKYAVGDPVTLKDGTTHKVIAINPDGSYQVD